MNKTELIAAMVEASGLTKKDCEAALAAFTSAVETAMKGGDKVQLVGFGSFEVKERPARVGRNPRTGESMRISSELCCASVRQFHLSNILRCEGVRTTLSSPSAKNCESVMPKASHIFSNDANDGVMSFLYHEEIVDCGKPERSAS